MSPLLPRLFTRCLSLSAVVAVTACRETLVESPAQRFTSPARATVLAGWYGATHLDDLVAGAGGTWANAINLRGQIVGRSGVQGSLWGVPGHAILWENGGLIDLGAGGYASNAADINERGQIVGYARATSAGPNRAVLWHDGDMTDLGTLGGGSSAAQGINQHGDVFGGSTTADDQSHAFIWRNGVMSDLGTLGGETSVASGLNETGQVVGYSTTPGGALHAFLWQNGAMTDLGTLGSPDVMVASQVNPVTTLSGWETRRDDVDAVNPDRQVIRVPPKAKAARVLALLQRQGIVTEASLSEGWSMARAINSQGLVVGAATTADGQQHAFVWQNGVMRDLGTLGGESSDALGVNNRGQVFGSSTTAEGQSHAFVWQNGVMTDLGTLGGESSEADAINERGQIVGTSLTADSWHAIRAFLWEDGVMTNLSVPIPLADLNQSFAVAISERGQVIGGTVERDNYYYGILWTPKPPNQE